MVTESFFPVVGGSEMAIRYLSDTFADLGHEVMVAVMNVKGASTDSTKFAFRTISPSIMGRDAKTFGKIKHCAEIVKEFRPDIVNAHFLFESGFVGTKAAHKNGVPSVVSIRGRGIFCKPKNMFERILFNWWIHGARKADGFLATSQEMADIAHARYGIEPRAISNGVDTTLFHPSKRTDIRSAHDIRPDQNIIVCARRLVPKNGIEYILRALPLIRRKADVILCFASPLGAEYDQYRSLITELQMEPFIRFLGSVPHSKLPDYFASADVVVQPSVAEARSLACLEAMASGAAIVATDTGGLKELITRGESGYLIPAFEESTYQVGTATEAGVTHLADAVIDVLTNHVLAEKLRRGARTYAEANSWQRICEQTLEMYEKAIHAKGLKG